MKYELLYRELIIQLRNRISPNSKLVEKLTEILPLAKMAVYRRLRQEVPFTFEEITAIAKELNISLDNMLRIDSGTTLPLRIQSIGEKSAIEIDYSMLEEYLQAIKDLASDPNGEISLVTNLLPQFLYAGFNSIYRFYHFKWQYYSLPVDQIQHYHEIIFPDRLFQIVKHIFINLTNIKTRYYIIGNQVFENFVNDVVYFNSIRLIRDEDILLIKDELFQFLDYMEDVATKGFVNIPSNMVYIYISDTSIDTSYCYIDSQFSFRIALIWSFIFNTALTFEDESLKMVKHWIRSKIRTSTLLSVTDEKQRTLYFEKQRKIVEQL